MTSSKDTSASGRMPCSLSFAQKRRRSISSLMKASHRRSVSKTRSQGSVSRLEADFNPINEDGSSSYLRPQGITVPVRNGGHQLPPDSNKGILYKPGLKVTDSYQLVACLGSGGYSQVFKAKDVRNGRLVALKVAKHSNGKLENNFTREIRILSTLKSHDKENSYRLIHSLDFFKFQNRICIVTALYSDNLHTVIHNNPYSPLPKRQLQFIAHQLLKGIAWLHKLGIVHADLKPSNIVLTNRAFRYLKNRDYARNSEHYQQRAQYRHVLDDAQIRIIDFGVAVFNDEAHPEGVSTRYNRAPEITMGLEWSYPCDIWSFACTLVELFAGKAPLPQTDTFEHLAMIQKFVGHGTSSLQQGRSIQKKLFHSYNNQEHTLFNGFAVNFPNQATTQASVKRVGQVVSIDDTFSMQTSFTQNMRTLLRKMFKYIPANRITASKALRHEFFDEVPDIDYVEEAVEGGP